MDAGIKGKWTHEDQKHEFVPYKQEFDEFWDDPVFLAKVEQFLKAFAARYDGNPDVAFVDLGSLGIYGECHTSKFNKDAKDKPERFRRIAKTHLSLFRRCLPNTYLVHRGVPCELFLHAQFPRPLLGGEQGRVDRDGEPPRISSGTAAR